MRLFVRFRAEDHCYNTIDYSLFGTDKNTLNNKCNFSEHNSKSADFE